MITLSANDFFLAKGTRGQIMCNKIKGMCLVMFYSHTCGYCQHFFPSFQDLSRTVNGCNFAVLNVLKNKGIIGLSKQSITPIAYVPFIVLYVDGKPHLRYDGPKDPGEIRRFLMEVAKRLSIRNTDFVPGKVQIDKERKIEKKGDEIPVYTVGIPISDSKNVCFLTYDDAYGGTSNGPKQQGGAAESVNNTCYQCFGEAYGGNANNNGGKQAPPKKTVPDYSRQQGYQSYAPQQQQQHAGSFGNP